MPQNFLKSVQQLASRHPTHEVRHILGPRQPRDGTAANRCSHGQFASPARQVRRSGRYRLCAERGRSNVGHRRIRRRPYIRDIPCQYARRDIRTCRAPRFVSQAWEIPHAPAKVEFASPEEIQRRRPSTAARRAIGPTLEPEDTCRPNPLCQRLSDSSRSPEHQHASPRTPGRFGDPDRRLSVPAWLQPHRATCRLRRPIIRRGA